MTKTTSVSLQDGWLQRRGGGAGGSLWPGCWRGVRCGGETCELMKVDVLTCVALAAASLVAMVTGGRSSGRRKHKEVFIGENSKFKFGG